MSAVSTSLLPPPLQQPPQKRPASPDSLRQAIGKRPALSGAPPHGAAGATSTGEEGLGPSYLSGGSSGSAHSSPGDSGTTAADLADRLILRPPHSPETYADLGAALRAGRLVAFPTETVYGLGANGLDAAAVLKIFEAKGRPLNDPCILHVPGPEEALELLDLDGAERAVFGLLATRCWPGPLSIVARARARVPREVTAQTDFVAVRCPAHPTALELLRAARVPVAAPSANRFGHISPTTPEHVAEDLGHAEDLKILDGGPCGVGIESTVVKLDLARRRVVVLRRGGTTGETLERILADGASRGLFGEAPVGLEYHAPHAAAAAAAGRGGDAAAAAQAAKSAHHQAEDEAPQQAPGMMLRHYAPAVPTFLLSCAPAASPVSQLQQQQQQQQDDVGDPAHAVLIDFGGRLREHAPHFLRTFELSAPGAAARGAASCAPREAGRPLGDDAEEACRQVFSTLRSAEAFAQSAGARLICVADFEPSGRGSYAEALHDRLFRAASGRRLMLDLGGKGEPAGGGGAGRRGPRFLAPAL